jgi:hypothetical protein
MNKRLEVWLPIPVAATDEYNVGTESCLFLGGHRCLREMDGRLIAEPNICGMFATHVEHILNYGPLRTGIQVKERY